MYTLYPHVHTYTLMYTPIPSCTHLYPHVHPSYHTHGGTLTLANPAHFLLYSTPTILRGYVFHYHLGFHPVLHHCKPRLHPAQRRCKALVCKKGGRNDTYLTRLRPREMFLSQRKGSKPSELSSRWIRLT